jgi:hypothetical protein
LQRTLLQAEIQKNSEKQPFTYSDSKQDSKEIPKVQVSANVRKRDSTFKASNTSQSLTRHSQNQSILHHAKHNGHKLERQRSQQHKNNMENHRSLKRTLLQAEIQKTNQKQRIIHSDSKQNGKELSDLLPSANMENQISTFKY